MEETNQESARQEKTPFLVMGSSLAFYPLFPLGYAVLTHLYGPGVSHSTFCGQEEWFMASIERTVYPRFTRAPSVKELREIYTPTPTNIAFVTTKARGSAQKFALMILLKVYERLHYFPDPQSIPGAVISHIRSVMKLPDDLVPDI